MCSSRKGMGKARKNSPRAWETGCSRSVSIATALRRKRPSRAWNSLMHAARSASSCGAASASASVSSRARPLVSLISCVKKRVSRATTCTSACYRVASAQRDVLVHADVALDLRIRQRGALLQLRQQRLARHLRSGSASARKLSGLRRQEGPQVCFSLLELLPQRLRRGVAAAVVPDLVDVDAGKLGQDLILVLGQLQRVLPVLDLRVAGEEEAHLADGEQQDDAGVVERIVDDAHQLEELLGVDPFDLGAEPALRAGRVGAGDGLLGGEELPVRGGGE